MDTPYLSVKNASFGFDSDRTIFHNVSFDLNKGEILTILGPNGAGKSTLLNCIGGFLTLKSGTVELCGKKQSAYSRRELARKIGYVSQIQARTYDYSVRDYVAMGRAPYIGTFRSPAAKDYALVDEALEKLGITCLAEKSYSKLSGGESQQVTIARVLVQQSDIVIFDEPTNHLDYGNQLKILRCIKQLAEDGCGVIWTTHMTDHALMLGGKIAVLNRSGAIEIGSADEMISEQRMFSLYDARICREYVSKAEREACVPQKL